MTASATRRSTPLLAVVLAVSVGDVGAILPGDMVAAVRGKAELEALPLVAPDISTPIGFIARTDDRPSRTFRPHCA